MPTRPAREGEKDECQADGAVRREVAGGRVGSGISSDALSLAVPLRLVQWLDGEVSRGKTKGDENRGMTPWDKPEVHTGADPWPRRLSPEIRLSIGDGRRGLAIPY